MYTREEAPDEYRRMAPPRATMDGVFSVSSFLDLGFGQRILPNDRGINVKNVEATVPKSRKDLINLPNHSWSSFEEKSSRFARYDVAVRAVVGEAHPAETMAGVQRDCRYKWPVWVAPLQLDNVECGRSLLQFL